MPMLFAYPKVSEIIFAMISLAPVIFFLFIFFVKDELAVEIPLF